MRTALVTTCWLENQDYYAKTYKWYKFYLEEAYPKLKFDKVVFIDNASSLDQLRFFVDLIESNTDPVPIEIVTREEHYDRPSWVDYKYLWYAVEYYQKLFNEGFTKIIYTDNDFFIKTKKAYDFINNFKGGWSSPWCPRHKFLETGFQLITSDSIAYHNFMREDPYRFNGMIEMEHALAPYIERNDLKGDRYFEYEKPNIPADVDFLAQIDLNQEVK